MKPTNRLQDNEQGSNGHGGRFASSSRAPEHDNRVQRWCRWAAQRTNRLLTGKTASFRVFLLGLGHSGLFVLAYWMAFCLRFDFAVPPDSREVFWMTLPWVLAVKLAVFFFSGNYHGWWRYVTFADLVVLLRAAGLSLLVVAAADHFSFSSHIPRVVLVLDCVVTVVALGSLRASWRLFREQVWPLFNPHDCRWALLIGADHSAGLLAHQIQSHAQTKYRIRGLLATDGESTGSHLGGIPIVGTAERLCELAAIHRTTDILVIAGSVPGNRLRQWMEACDAGGLTLKIIPPLQDLFDGDRRIPVRDIEINDLLHREPVQLDSHAVGTLLEGRTVMVTGAGGSIGSEICRQVLRFKPRQLVLVGRGENRIFFVERELQACGTATTLWSCIGDITDVPRMRRLFEEHRPEVVFHAAAHKHVPLMEANVGEAIKNNVLGTRCLADLADQTGVQNFVLISTDKAVNPSSVMGASKQLAERYVHALSQESATRFTVVRFGNVLGSTGSVVPIFQEQIRRGGPITVTDLRMTRFFMTIPEASQLVLQAAAMGKGGEIFVLDMGEPIRIIDLARDLIRLSGLPEEAIEIVVTGTRPGEKLYEELYFGEEETLATSHPKLRAAYHRFDTKDEARQSIAELAALVDGQDASLLRKLHEVVPEFQPPSSTSLEQTQSSESCALIAQE
ncbi:MAG: nucleoside-diphosphate sugar epimerase/dehydratase [Planctomycetota bacterium]|nr:nucleoside-diphosphate sugar epimerase/dehydratase [Planctomycetota bacterium]